MKMKLKLAKTDITKMLHAADRCVLSAGDYLFGAGHAMRATWLLAIPLLLIAFSGAHRVLTNTAVASIAPDAHVSISEMKQEDITRKARSLRNAAIRNPEKLAAFSSRDLLIMMDEPDLIRAEGAARMWQYSASSCVLDVYLQSGANGEKVLHHEIRPRRAAKLVADSAAADDAVNKRACIDSLAQRRLSKTPAAIQ